MKYLLTLLSFIPSINIFPQNWLKVDSVFNNVNLQIGGDPKPAFTDLDDDGDLDLLVGIGESFNPGPEPGLTLGFRNIGTSQESEFTLDNTLVSRIPDVGLNSYPTFADLDNDEDYDLLIGRDGGALFYYENTGTQLNSAWTRELTTFASVEVSTYWKNPCFADLDNDEDFDLIYGTSSGIIYVYRNSGTPSNPDFQYYPDYFKIIRLDGNSATVSLADFDDDGDNDLLSGIWTGEFIYFRNDGNNLIPMFTQTTMPFSNLSVNSYSSPVFVDLDNDQDYDIVSGALNGQVFYYVNSNGSFVENNTIFNSIDVGYTSIPAFADIDADGDLDLLVGAETGSESRFYLNDGNNIFQQNASIFSGISFPNYSRPTLADIDNDEDYDLIIGRLGGDIRFYRNEGNKFLPEWVNEDSLFTGIEVDQSAHPGFADMDGDLRKDLILGEYNGNFTFYKNLFTIVPVELTSFTAKVNSLGQAVLTWVTASEINNRGYEVERKKVNDRFITIGFVEGLGTTSEEQAYSFEDRSVTPGVYIYRLKQIDFNGQFEYSPEVEIEIIPPLEFGLEQNYPNPFNPSTKIRFTVTAYSYVSLKLYDVLGNEMETLISEKKEAGSYEIEVNAPSFSSGIYFYKLQAGNFIDTKKMILLK